MALSSVLANTSFQSPLAQASKLNPRGHSKKRNLIADLLLTSLVDALSILVIYLLMNFSATGEALYMSKNIQLPVAGHGEELSRHTVVKVENGQFYIEDKAVEANSLTERLIQIKKSAVSGRGADDSSTVTVQADKSTTYEVLNQIVLASAQAGYGDIKFAVLGN